MPIFSLNVPFKSLTFSDWSKIPPKEIRQMISLQAAWNEKLNPTSTQKNSKKTNQPEPSPHKMSAKVSHNSIGLQSEKHHLMNEARLIQWIHA